MPEHRDAKRILVVDDDPDIVRFVDRVLREAGYLTRTASSGPEALEIADSADPFDLILTDVRMPEMTGPDLIRRIRVRQPDVPVLYLTGFNEQLFATRNILWEGEAFLDKPATVQGLLEAVALLLHGRVLVNARQAS